MGSRINLRKMGNAPNPIPVGSMGTLQCLDDIAVYRPVILKGCKNSAAHLSGNNAATPVSCESCPLMCNFLPLVSYKQETCPAAIVCWM